MINYIATPTLRLLGEIRPPSDKSISHRALLLSSLTLSETKIKNLLLSGDVLDTIRALQLCGVQIEKDGNHGQKSFVVFNRTGTLSTPRTPIYCGNSGTLVRLFTGIAAGQGITCRLTGDSSLSKRPMKRVVAPLLQMGASIDISSTGVLPIEISKNLNGLNGILYKSPLASAQVKTCILMAGLQAKNSTIIVEPYKSRDHTEIMLKAFNIPIRTSTDGSVVELQPGHTLRSPGAISISADPSSAMFYAVGALISQDSSIRLRDVGLNPTRLGGFNLLNRMGANIKFDNKLTSNGEISGDISINTSQLNGIEITAEDIPSAIDDLPAIMIAAATAKGKTIITGARELRSKECDRIAAMALGLKNLGISCTELEDGIIIKGKNTNKNAFSGGKIDSFGDHRIAMSFAVASACAKKEIYIENCDNVQTSFPHFIRFSNSIGLRLVEEKS